MRATSLYGHTSSSDVMDENGPTQSDDVPEPALSADQGLTEGPVETHPPQKPKSPFSKPPVNTATPHDEEEAPLEKPASRGVFSKVS